MLFYKRRLSEGAAHIGRYAASCGGALALAGCHFHGFCGKVVREVITIKAAEVTPTILLVDDDPAVQAVNMHCLKGEGYRVQCAANDREALAVLREFSIELIVLDVLLENQSGFDLIRSIREISDAPVLFLSALDRIDDRVTGLSLGDDYLCKPYSLRELCARIRLLLRRSERESTSINLPPLHMNLINNATTLDGVPIDLTDTEFKILYALAKAPNACVTFQALNEEVWQRPYYSAQNVMVHISSIRKKLYVPPNRYNYIQSVRGQGYIFVHPPRILNDLDLSQ